MESNLFIERERERGIYGLGWHYQEQRPPPSYLFFSFLSLSSRVVWGGGLTCDNVKGGAGLGGVRG